uniref:Uncharacterized protein n=1 Tax=Rhizophagus irregularis (strain DAOM 181602 / DAOM 197198 / MUCL 43194) TaxID=747089 RepID=U9TNE5_RHIID
MGQSAESVTYDLFWRYPGSYYIKRASTSKSKVYIKPVIDNLCELSESSDNSSDNFSTISLTEEEIIEPPNGSLQDLMKHFKYKLQDQYYTDNNITIIFINENTIVESLIEWAKNADDKDLLQRPSIDLALEDVTDTGGVFKQVISIFWNKTILHYGQWPQWLNKFHIQYLIDEKIEHEKILKECNPIFYKLVRQLKKKKSNFNDLLHSWMNNCDINIDHIKTLNNNEAASYVAKYEVITIRKNALDDFKLGFNKFNIINELKNYKYHNIVRELYYKITYNIVIDQFDSEYIELQAQSHNKPQYRLLYEEFKELLRSMDEEELNNVMKFAIGSSIIPALPKIKISWVKLNTDEVKLWHNRLPHASTCGNLLTFCENYEISPQGFNTFKEDLRSGFINHEGFSEPVYSRNYNSNFILQNEINNELEFSSSQLNNTATGTLVQPTSNINSGNSVENAIPVDALELSTDSYQNVNSNIPNVRQMVTFRWVNVTNPLERRTRRESAEF